MILTNKHNLPERWVKVIESTIFPPKEDGLRVSEAGNPPLIKQLMIKHWEELEEDASERIWAFLGIISHKILEEIMDDGEAEKGLKQTINGTELTGRSDLVIPDERSIEDWKVTSVWSVIGDTKPEWIRQLNLYALLARESGIEIDILKIHAITRDWIRGKRFERGYPPIPFTTVDVPLWSLAEQRAYATQRIAVHNSAPVACTEEEMWAKPTKWAVKKKGNKRAINGGVCDSPSEANKIASAYKHPCEIEVRQGERTRCLDYCSVRKFCPFNIYNKKGA
jgi:hypothetical protein